MKLSNALLSVITMFAVGIVVGCAIMTSPKPAIVVNIPPAQIFDGSGYEVKYPEHPSNRQAELLGLAYNIAKKDGHKYPQLLQGILLQETAAGALPRYKVIGQEFGLKPNERYYGIMQLKLRATWDVLRRWPGLKQEFNFNTFTDEEIISKLIDDDRFNLAIASKYLLILRDRGFTTMAELAMAYNKGPGGAHHSDPSTNEYAQGVISKISALKVKKEV